MTNGSGRCLDCGLLYADFPLDVHLPRRQWLDIHPADHGVLCARCIVKRAARLPGVTLVHMIFEVVVDEHVRRQLFLETVNRRFAALREDDPVLWAEEQRERAAWDTTLQDGPEAREDR